MKKPIPSEGSLDQPFALTFVTLLAALALLVHGYHPYSEDGGLYVAGIKHLLDPTLYPYSLPFVEAHLRYSLFATLVAALVRATRLSLPAVLLTLHLASLWTTLYAVWLLAAHSFHNRIARAGATALVAATLTVPVAGTSLILMDPYLTARSLSLPCTLLALAAVLQMTSNWGASRRASETWASRRSTLRPILLCILALTGAAAMHPLMAAYALGDVILLAALLFPRRAVRRWGAAALCALAVLAAALLQATALPEPTGYLPIAVSRYYWFLSQWQWYELLGLAAPLAILATKAWVPHPSRPCEGWGGRPAPHQALARMALASGLTAILVALTYAHEQSSTHLIARLQPLRAFQVIYVLMLLIIGGWLGERMLRQNPWRWAALFALLSGLMFYVQRDTYPASSHIEWPHATPSNPWAQVFLWIAANTPKEALFALDADYTAAHGEDTQGFRALAERSALPDYSKDGGEASITPTLTAAWQAGQAAQQHLSEETDDQRLAALRPFNVTWVVLQQHAQTAFACPYRNPLVKVCRLP